jgi:hypothetical protein
MKLKNIIKQILVLLVCLNWLPSVYAQLNAEVTPGNNFDLSEWKLNYPMMNEEQEDLSDFTNNYFYTDTLTGGMVFKCPNITISTGGSTYPRCELRELLNKGASASNKSNNWTLSTNSTKDEYGGYNGVLFATLRVDRVSNTYDDLYHVGRVIIGQIHGDDNEPCRIYYRLLPGHTKGSIYFAHEQSKVWGDDKQEFWHVLIGSKDSDAEEPENGIALGEIWSYKIDVKDESMTVTIYDSTKTEIASKTISSELTGSDNFDASYGNADNYLYFKAGVYNQNNGGESDDYAQATFFELTNTHNTGSDEVSAQESGLSISKLYPNPCEGNFVVENSLDCTLQIYNFVGDLVYKQSIMSNYEDIKTGLPNGIYLVTINSYNKTTLSKKIIVK